MSSQIEQIIYFVDIPHFLKSLAMTKKNDNVELEYWEEVVLTDPTTGKKFTQKVKITRYKSQTNKDKGVIEELEDELPAVLPEEDLEDQE